MSSESDRPPRAVGSQPFTCYGRPRRSGLFSRGTDPPHTTAEASVLIVYADGQTEVVCPLCGRYELE